MQSIITLPFQLTPLRNHIFQVLRSPAPSLAAVSASAKIESLARSPSPAGSPAGPTAALVCRHRRGIMRAASAAASACHGALALRSRSIFSGQFRPRWFVYRFFPNLFQIRHGCLTTDAGKILIIRFSDASLAKLFQVPGGRPYPPEFFLWFYRYRVPGAFYRYGRSSCGHV